MQSTTQPSRATEKFLEILKAADALLPGATDFQQTDALSATRGMPSVAKAKGAMVTDVDGNQFLDLAGAGGSLLLGHADETIIVAINKAAAKGCLHHRVSEMQIRLAELIVSRIVAVDQLRFFPALGLATREAIESAKRASGKTRIIRFDGCHRGCPLDETLVLPYNDADALTAAFKAHGEHISAILLQPIAHGFGLALPSETFIAAINKNCHDRRTLLIADESLTGLRVGPGGAAQLFNLTPDLTLLGDVIGGGLPLAAVGGKKNLLTRKTSGDPVEHNPAAVSALAVSAGVATLQSLAETDGYQLLDDLATQLEGEIKEAAEKAKVAVHINRAPGLLGLYFSDQPVHDLASAKKTNLQRYESFYNAMLDRGVLIPHSSFAPMMLNMAYSQEQMDQAIEAVQESLNILK